MSQPPMVDSSCQQISLMLSISAKKQKKKKQEDILLDKKKFEIGVLGGMGTYATISLDGEHLMDFTAEEWER